MGNHGSSSLSLPKASIKVPLTGRKTGKSLRDSSTHANGNETARPANPGISITSPNSPHSTPPSSLGRRCPSDGSIFNRVRNGSFTPMTRREPNLLTAWQKQLIRKSWAKHNKHGFDHIGIRVYMKLTDKKPEIKRVFNFADVPRPQLKFNHAFTHQAELFVGVLNNAIRDLDETGGRLHDFLRSLGARHAHLTPGRFKVVYWDAFAESMLEVVIEAQGVHSARGLVTAWRVFIFWLIETMKDGYYSEVQDIKHASRVADNPSPSSRSSYSDDRTSEDLAPWKEIQQKFQLPIDRFG